jgi:FkbM family methyltransferase
LNYTINGIPLTVNEEGYGAFNVFNPDSDAANDRGPCGMVEELKAFMRITRGCTRLVDVGALFGIFSLVFTADPAKSAVAIEASPWAYPILVEHCEMNPAHRIHPVQAFAGDVTGRQVDCAREWKHVLANLPRTEGERITLTETAIDDMPDVGPFDCIKIDVEAYEVGVLRGAAGSIQEYRPIMFIEVHTNNLCDNGETGEGLLDLIRGWGYRVETVDGKPLDSFDGISMTRIVCYP